MKNYLGKLSANCSVFIAKYYFVSLLPKQKLQDNFRWIVEAV